MRGVIEDIVCFVVLFGVAYAFIKVATPVLTHAPQQQNHITSGH